MFSTLTSRSKMILFGSTPMMGSTQRPQCTKLNFLAWLYPPWIPWFGKYGHLQKVKFLLGWHYKIGFGPHNGWKSVVGQTVAFASYVKENKKQVHISSSSVVIRLGSEGWSSINFISNTWILQTGTWRKPSKHAAASHAFSRSSTWTILASNVKLLGDYSDVWVKANP